VSRDEETIRGFLTENFLFEFGDSVGRDSNLFQLGLIDSFGFVELVAFLEAKFDVKLEDEDLVSGDLTSLSGMVTTLWRKRDA
jgi:acyl carrier protein